MLKKIADLYENDWFLATNHEIRDLRNSCAYSTEGFHLYGATNARFLVCKSDTITLIAVNASFEKSIKENLDQLELKKQTLKEISKKITSIQGVFTLLAWDGERLTVITSRFNVPLTHYFISDNYRLVSNSNAVISIALKQKGLHNWNETSFYEYLKFKRLFGGQTHTKGVMTLPPASTNSFVKNNVSSSTYHDISYEKVKTSLPEASSHLLSLLSSSVGQIQCVEGKFALMQSGGLDTRLILSCLPDMDAVGITITHLRNRELLTAQKMLSHKN